MKFVAFLSGLCGVVAGLLFGVLLWGGAGEAGGTGGARAGGPHDAEILAALRDIRALLEQQPAGFRGAGSAPSPDEAPAAAAPQPLSAGASMDEFRAALAEAVSSLQRAAAGSGGGFSGEVLGPDVADRLALMLSPDGKEQRLALFGSTPREVYRQLGRPEEITVEDGRVVWSYGEKVGSWDWRRFRVVFTDGYVSSASRVNDPAR